MSDDESAGDAGVESSGGVAAAPEPASGSTPEDGGRRRGGRRRRTGPSWWHRDHPTFTALTGFYTGLAFIIVIPGTFAGLLSALFDQERAEELFPLILVVLAIPLALLVPRRTRRFATYMWIGILSTLVVVLGVAATVLWFLIN